MIKKIKRFLGCLILDSLEHPALMAADILAVINIICMIQLVIVG